MDRLEIVSSVYKRIETDIEFRARMPDRIPSDTTSKEMDEIAWARFQMQRRIIEDIA